MHVASFILSASFQSTNQTNIEGGPLSEEPCHHHFEQSGVL